MAPVFPERGDELRGIRRIETGYGEIEIAVPVASDRVSAGRDGNLLGKSVVLVVLVPPELVDFLAAFVQGEHDTAVLPPLVRHDDLVNAYPGDVHTEVVHPFPDQDVTQQVDPVLAVAFRGHCQVVGALVIGVPD